MRPETVRFTYAEVTFPDNDVAGINKLSSLIHVPSSALADYSYPFPDGGVFGDLSAVQEGETAGAGGHFESRGGGNAILNEDG